jgi:two-component system chemotaxis sensor kinase CheA
MNNDDQLLYEFRSESRRSLQEIESDLLILGRNPGDRDRIDAVFRGMHTIKGNAGFFEQESIVSLGHAAENLMDQVRSGDLAMSAAIGDVLLETVDALKDLLGDSPPNHPPAGLVERIQACQQAGQSAGPAPSDAGAAGVREEDVLMKVDLDSLRQHIECKDGVRAGLE